MDISCKFLKLDLYTVFTYLDRRKADIVSLLYIWVWNVIPLNWRDERDQRIREIVGIGEIVENGEIGEIGEIGENGEIWENGEIG